MADRDSEVVKERRGRGRGVLPRLINLCFAWWWGWERHFLAAKMLASANYLAVQSPLGAIRKFETADDLAEAEFPICTAFVVFASLKMDTLWKFSIKQL